MFDSSQLARGGEPQRQRTTGRAGWWILFGIIGSIACVTTPAGAAPTLVLPTIESATASAADDQKASLRGANIPIADEGGEEEPEREEPSRWRQSSLTWIHSATTQTLGVGQDYQSANPTYIWTFLFSPRYSVLEEGDYNMNVRADVSMTVELTDSDSTTTDREIQTAGAYGEDGRLALSHSLNLYEDGEFITGIGALLPDFGLPISKTSRLAGRILGLGLRLYPRQTLPLRGNDADWLRSLTLRGIGGYTYNFTRTTTPAADDLGRIRFDVEGRPVPAEQLGGAAFTQQFFIAGVDSAVSLHRKLFWNTSVLWYPGFRYPIGQDDVCGPVLTGCSDPLSVDDPSTYTVSTFFQTSIEARVVDWLTITAGYENLALQLGPDGRRRNLLYSPNARFTLALTAHLGEIYGTARRGQRWGQGQDRVAREGLDGSSEAAF